MNDNELTKHIKKVNNVLDIGQITSSSKLDGSNLPPTGSKGIYGKYEVLPTERGYDDSGDFSRYFSLDAWAEQNLTQFVIEPKAGKGERNENLYGFEEHTEGAGSLQFGADGSLDGKTTKTRNIHPSVKPIDIMSYLIKLSTREGDTVLDPFLGLGTTMIAARNLRRNCIGMEREEQYIKIAKGRLTVECNAEDGQY